MKLARITDSVGFKIVFYSSACLLALLFSLIAITNNPILIGLAVGMVLGLFLLANPKITIWLVILLGLATPALLDMLGHGMSRMLWGVAMMALLLWIPGLFNLIHFNPKQPKYIPAFLWIALVFCLYAVVVSIAQLYSMGEFLGGFKRYFQGFGLMFALAAVTYQRQDFDQWLKALLYVALLQFPFALFERFALVPLRGGLASGAESTDIVAGTMGANMDGGSPNAIMVLLVLVAWGFVMARWKEKVIDIKSVLILSFLLLIPLALGETKVVIVLIPLVAFVLLARDFFKDPVRFLPLITTMIVLTIGLAYLYVYIMLDTTFEQAFRGMWEYNVNEMGYGNLILNRTTAFTFWLGLHGWHDPISLLFGHGLGSSYGSGLDAGHMAQLYPKYGINLTALTSILWDVGILGFILYLAIFIVAWMQVHKVSQISTDKRIHADCTGIKIGLAMTLFFIIYSDSQVNLMVHEIITACILGYAAFLYRDVMQGLKKV